MQYFDFHTHVILKQLFDDNPNIDTRIRKNDIAGIPQYCTDLPNIIQSQVHQSQLADFAEEIIVGATLYSLESYLAREVIPLRQHLKSTSQHKLSLTVLNDVVNNNLTAFTDFLMGRTLDKYLNAPESFHILTKQSFDAPLPKNKVNVFFVIEGCHSLVDSHNEYAPPQRSFPPAEILANIDSLLVVVNIVAINPTHMQQSNLCNHAFGIQITATKPFYPRGNGLTNEGREVIRGIFQRGICIDIKHMSYWSRKQLRDEIDNGDYPNPQPLLCTHAGFTGCSFEDWPGYIQRKRSADETFYIEVVKTMQTRNEPRRPGAPAFNMTTINLFDEEIAWIVQHDGMIGLSMDRRILGYVDRFDARPTGIDLDSFTFVDKEYISKTEWSSMGISNSQIGTKIIEGDYVTRADVELSTEESIPQRDEYFFDHVLIHLKHYFQVCVNAGIPINKAQKHITLGSDFDGLINPFLNMQVSQDMVELKNYIKMNFGYYLNSLTDSQQWAGQLNIPMFVEDLFYRNGYNFIRSWFTK